MKRNIVLISSVVAILLGACSSNEETVMVGTEESSTGMVDLTTSESSDSSSTTESSGVDHLDEGLKASGDDAPSLCELLLQCMEDKQCPPFSEMCADECALETGADRGECGIVW